MVLTNRYVVSTRASEIEYNIGCYVNGTVRGSMVNIMLASLAHSRCSNSVSCSFSDVRGAL